ncbi:MULTISPECIES: hypothetical protein [unclassified Streptomyces]|uniref:hypothetical protein n=1 Tax=unclassified Streptomyces TaxID=2593676 RepID=UPI0035E13B09
MNKPIVPAQTFIPEVDIVTVTPELAKKWLSQNTHNRPLRKRAIADYARDMAAGSWLQNGEAIKFAEDGTLLDGQHRLNAVVAAGVDVTMLVVSGLPRATQETMDAGRKRTAADAFSLRGEVHATVLAAVLKRVWLWDQGDYKFGQNYTPTTAECAALLKERPEIYRSVEIAVRIHQAFRYLPQSVTGTAHHLLSRIDGAEAVWFFARIGDGAELPAGHPVLTLRNRVMTDRADNRKVPDHQYMAYLIRAWNAVRDNRSLTRIQQASDAPMPLPK